MKKAGKTLLYPHRKYRCNGFTANQHKLRSEDYDHIYCFTFR